MSVSVSLFLCLCLSAQLFVCSVNIHDACFNLYFATCEEHDPLKPQDDPQQFSSEGHADSLYHPSVGSPG